VESPSPGLRPTSPRWGEVKAGGPDTAISSGRGLGTKAGKWRRERLAELKGERVPLGSTVFRIMVIVVTAIEFTNSPPQCTRSTAPLPP
jgi:hypothetical protein